MTGTADEEASVRPAPALASTASTSQFDVPGTAAPSPGLSSSSLAASTQNALPTYLEASTVPYPPGSVAGSSTNQQQAPSSSLAVQGADSFFDIAPRSDSTSFQVGYLGLKGFQAWLKGDVLVKLDTETKQRGRYTRCTVQLQAKEQVSGPGSEHVQGASDSGALGPPVVELFSYSLVLWDADKEPTSSSAALPTVPSTMPFSFPLTADLPHCVHLRDSSLTYTITASLFSEDAGKLPHAIKTVPVHLVRYTRPGPLNEIELAELDGAVLPNEEHTLQPHTWVEQTPTLVYAQINRTIFRRAEPIELRVHIPSPAPTAVSEKGLKLRAVEADLIRIIHVKPHTGQGADAGDAPQRSSSTAQDRASDPNVHEALLAHSGKLCRFHSKRPVLLRLALHPPFDRANMPHPHPDHDALASGPVFGRGGGGGCESISQETLMHKVSFEVRIKIGILGGRGERRDIVLRRSVKILPGAAGALEDLSSEGESGQTGSSVVSEKERLKRSEKARMLAEENHSGASSSRSPDYASDMLDFGMYDEYDGYEDVGRSLHDWTDAADPSDAAGSSSQGADHSERLEQLRQFLDASDSSARNDGPPPSLLESRNDLQVEVEVEGVGLAVPRNAYRHPADPYPETPGIDEELFPPPPPIDAQLDDAPSVFAVLPSNGAAFSSPVNHQAESLPDSHQAEDMELGEVGGSHDVSSSQVQALAMPGGLEPVGVRRRDAGQSSTASLETAAQDSMQRYTRTARSLSTAPVQSGDAESHPSYEAAVSGALTHRTDNPSGSVHHEPPPYAHGPGITEPVPSFYQAVHEGIASDLSTPRGALSSHGSRREVPQVGPQILPGHSIAQSAEYQPPAYATSPHPPSYDA